MFIGVPSDGFAFLRELADELSNGGPLTRMPRGCGHLADSGVAWAIRMRSFMA